MLPQPGMAPSVDVVEKVVSLDHPDMYDEVVLVMKVVLLHVLEYHEAGVEVSLADKVDESVHVVFHGMVVELAVVGYGGVPVTAAVPEIAVSGEEDDDDTFTLAWLAVVDDAEDAVVAGIVNGGG